MPTHAEAQDVDMVPLVSDEATTLLSLPPDLVAQVLAHVELVSLGAVACSCCEFQLLLAGISIRHILAAGAHHSAFASNGDRLLTCGTDENRRGILGHGRLEGVDPLTAYLHPTPTVTPCSPASRVVAVATHSLHTLALTAAGEVYSFGYGVMGQLGHGDTQTCWHPKHIEALHGVHVKGIAAGEQHSLVVDHLGVAYSFGSGFSGKLGLGDQCPRSVPFRIAACPTGEEGLDVATEAVAAVAAGACHTLLVTAGGALYTCGAGVMGQLGHGSKHHELHPRRVAALASTAVVQAAGGLHHSLAVDREGRCFSWGSGEARERTSSFLGGFLGHQSLEDQLVPRGIQALLGVRVHHVAAGSYHSMALTADGAVYTWGDGGGGKLGHNDDERMHWVPQRVAALNGMPAAAISAGESHCLCVLRDGQILGWGAGCAIGLGHEVMRLREAVPASWGSAGNYEWTPGDVLRSWQAHLPTKVRLATEC